MNWFTFSLIAMACFVIYDFLSRTMSVESKHPVILSGLMSLFAAIIAFVIFLFSGSSINVKELPILSIILTIVVMIIWSIFGRLEYTAKKMTDLSEFLIIIKLAPIFTFLLSLVFLGEGITNYKIVAVILTVVANILITIDSNFKFKINKGLVLSLITSLCLGFAWTFDKVVSPNFSVSFYTFMAFIFPAITILLIPPVKLEIIKEELNGKKFLSIMILGFTNAVGYFMMISAMGTGEVSKVVLIISTAAIITVFLAIFILKEKEGAFKKIIATILVVIATILLAL